MNLYFVSKRKEFEKPHASNNNDIVKILNKKHAPTQITPASTGISSKFRNHPPS